MFIFITNIHLLFVRFMACIQKMKKFERDAMICDTLIPFRHNIVMNLLITKIFQHSLFLLLLLFRPCFTTESARKQTSHCFDYREKNNNQFQFSNKKYSVFFKTQFFLLMNVQQNEGGWLHAWASSIECQTLVTKKSHCMIRIQKEREDKTKHVSGQKSHIF